MLNRTRHAKGFLPLFCLCATFSSYSTVLFAQRAFTCMSMWAGVRSDAEGACLQGWVGAKGIKITETEKLNKTQTKPKTLQTTLKTLKLKKKNRHQFYYIYWNELWCFDLVALHLLLWCFFWHLLICSCVFGFVQFCSSRLTQTWTGSL